MKVALSLFLLFVSSCNGLAEIPHRARGGIAWRKHTELTAGTPIMGAENWISQLLDHENSSMGHFPQRYFEIKDYWDQKNGPVFLEIGGEGPAAPSSGFIINLAQENKALVLTLEHRFYGNSVPFHDFSLNNLQYLTTRQALADLDYFISYMAKDIGQRKWFVFGGSYSGALSAWFRLKYPQDSVGSHSSSGVVNARYEFPQFDEQVAEAVGDDCANLLRLTTKAFEQAVANNKGDHVRSLFGMNKTTSNGDFFYMIADSAAMGDQYGHKAALCSAMQSSDKTPDGLITTFSNWTNSFWGSTFGSNCFYDTECLKSDPSKWQPTSRAWRWQKCSELAYFQIAPAQNSLRSTLYETMEYVQNQCIEIFGKVIPDTNATNSYYGGANVQSTNVFFSDFSDDPWQRASINKTQQPSSPFNLVTCDGCGHCQDLYPPQPTDPAPLVQERVLLRKFVSGLLNK